jgi:hypothetical protein
LFYGVCRIKNFERCVANIKRLKLIKDMLTSSSRSNLKPPKPSTELIHSCFNQRFSKLLMIVFITSFLFICTPLFSKADTNSAYLTSLRFSGGTLTPCFDKDITTYTLEIGAVAGVVVTPTAEDENSTIKVNDKSCKSGSSVIVSLPLDLTRITVVVIQTNGYSKCYTINIVHTYSLDASLSALSISSGELSPAFYKNTVQYSVSVENSVQSITITPTVASSLHAITVNGSPVVSGGSYSLPLNVGTNTAIIFVSSQNGTSKKYTITITRLPSSNANLSGLTLSSGTLSPNFSENTLEYTAKVDNSVSQISVSPTLSDAVASFTVNGSAGQTVALDVGENIVSILVTAEDGTTKTYTVTVTRLPSSNADLSSLSLSSGTLSPAFDKNTVKYSAIVANFVSEISVCAETDDSSASFTVNGSTEQQVKLAVGSNNITVLVTAADSSTKTYKITVTRLSSSNADLSSLALSSGSLSPSFNKDTLDYTASVDNSVSKLYIAAAADDSTASVKINGSTSGYVTLVVGSNTVSILVTAEDGTTKTYRITVTRLPSSNADLSSLKLSYGTLSPAFNKNILEYTASVDNSVSKITVCAELSDSTASFTVNGSTEQSAALYIGTNTITVSVTAQDGTVKTYTVTVTRLPSSNTNLSSLALSSGTLSPAFDKNTVKYSATVDNSVSEISVCAKTDDSAASFTVNGSTEQKVKLAIGSNTITVLVTAADGSTKTYKITVTRLASSNADLASLTLGSGTLNPAFDKNTLNYTADVENSVSKLYISAVTDDPASSVTVNGSSSQYASLNVGYNTINVTVSAASGAKKTYTITVFRKYSSQISINTKNSSGAYSADVPDYISYFENDDAITFELGTATILIPAETLKNCKGNGSLSVWCGETSQTALQSAEYIAPDSCVIVGGYDIGLIKDGVECSFALNSETSFKFTSDVKALLKKGTPSIYRYDADTNSFENINAVFDLSAGTVQFKAADTGIYIVAVALSKDYISYTVTADSHYSGTTNRSFNVKVERGSFSPRIPNAKLMIVTTLSTGAQEIYYKDITADSFSAKISVSSSAVESSVYLISGSFDGNSVPTSFALVRFVTAQ